MTVRAGHLVASEVTKRFAGLTAVDEVSLEVRPGEVVGLIGPNGAGKTTLFNCLTGFMPPTQGRVHLDGEDITDIDPPGRASRGIARTFQQSKLFVHLSVRENLLLGRHLHYGASSWQSAIRTPAARRAEREAIVHVDELADVCGLGDVLASPVGDLPYGTQRMVEIARALATEPSVLLLDEPCAGMDPTESAEFVQLMQSINARRPHSVLVIEHDVATVLSVCERVYVLEFGRLIAEGTPAQITKNPLVREAYLGSEVARV